MPAPKKPTSFDGHLGSIIADSARRKGGRPFIAQLIGVSAKTVDRRALGDGSYSVKELHLIADALNMSATELVERALRDYSNGTPEDGVQKLIRAEGANLVSDRPASLSERRSAKTPADMSDTEREGLPHAAFTNDPEIGHDEQ